MKKLKITLIVIIVLVIAIFGLFNIPGDISIPTQARYELPPISSASSKVEIYLLETGHVNTPEAFTMAQGSLFKSFSIIHGAVLVKHDNDVFMFDTGLGRNIDSQFAEDMPFWLKPLMEYEKEDPAVDQLQNSNLPQPNHIILSHAHWDHASGVVDFPNLEIWVLSSELEYIKSALPPAIFPSQVGSPDIKWKEYKLNKINYAGFSQSLDLYGDGTVVLVALPGHSPGSVGLFVNAKDGVRRFFVGDAVWNLNAVQNLKKKFWLSSNMVDDDKKATSLIVAKLYALMQANPDLKIIPAHDKSTWK